MKRYFFIVLLIVAYSVDSYAVDWRIFYGKLLYIDEYCDAKLDAQGKIIERKQSTIVEDEYLNVSKTGNLLVWYRENIGNSSYEIKLEGSTLFIKKSIGEAPKAPKWLKIVSYSPNKQSAEIIDDSGVLRLLYIEDPAKKKYSWTSIYGKRLLVSQKCDCETDRHNRVISRSNSKIIDEEYLIIDNNSNKVTWVGLPNGKIVADYELDNNNNMYIQMTDSLGDYIMCISILSMDLNKNNIEIMEGSSVIRSLQIDNLPYWNDVRGKVLKLEKQCNVKMSTDGKIVSYTPFKFIENQIMAFTGYGLNWNGRDEGNVKGIVDEHGKRLDIISINNTKVDLKWIRICGFDTNNNMIETVDNTNTLRVWKLTNMAMEE
ncbi:MAG: hypothetical protein MJ211_12540 [Bacteroidales bacterium]|nr:hypothetical protein [Bacteroidales bacterium]